MPTACPRCGSRRLRDLRHPMSVDLWIDSVAAHAKVILVRILGGYDWWRYGCDQLAAVARATRHRAGAAAGRMPRRGRAADRMLSTLPRAGLDALCSTISARAGRTICARWSSSGMAQAGRPCDCSRSCSPVAVPKAGFYEPGRGEVGGRSSCRTWPTGSAGRPDPVLPLDAAGRRRRADRRAVRGAARSAASRRCRSSSPA